MPTTAKRALGPSVFGDAQSLLGGPDLGRPHASTAALLQLALASGDERLAVDPGTGRNRYGVPPRLAADESWFASSTASAISPRAHRAVTCRLSAMFESAGAASLADWPSSIRDRLQTLFGVPGSEIILAGSGTDAELIALSLARHLFSRPITNIVVAPDETGSGVRLAAGGRHFLGTTAFGSAVDRAAPIEGLGQGDLTVRTVDIRDADGGIRAAETVDDEVRSKAEKAVAEGRSVLVHGLDASKTGLSGFRRSAALALQRAFPDRCLVVIDACQLRCSEDQIRQDLAAGCLVAITGSKFAGGPPFSGALLVPPCLAGRLAGLRLPPGLAAYSAARDWPDALRPGGEVFRENCNLGLYVRWEAALAELEPYFAIARDRRREIARRFRTLVRDGAAAIPGLRMPPSGPAGPSDAIPTIFPFFSIAPDGSILDARRLHAALADGSRSAAAGRRYHVGQPVVVGGGAVLRICLSAVHVNDVAGRIASGMDAGEALTPLAQDLHALLATWSRLGLRTGAHHVGRASF